MMYWLNLAAEKASEMTASKVVDAFHARAGETNYAGTLYVIIIVSLFIGAVFLVLNVSMTLDNDGENDEAIIGRVVKGFTLILIVLVFIGVISI